MERAQCNIAICARKALLQVLFGQLEAGAAAALLASLDPLATTGIVIPGMRTPGIMVMLAGDPMPAPTPCFSSYRICYNMRADSRVLANEAGWRARTRAEIVTNPTDYRRGPFIALRSSIC